MRPGMGLGDVGYGVVQQLVVNRHILPLLRFAVEAVAKGGDWRRFAGGGRFKNGQGLPGVGAAVADGAIGEDVDQIAGMHRAGGLLPGVGRRGVALAQQEYHPRSDGCGGILRGYGVDPGRHRFQGVPVPFQVAQQLGKEMV